MRITLSLKKGNPHSSLIILLNFLIYIPSFPCLHARGRTITFDYYNAYILAIITPVRDNREPYTIIMLRVYASSPRHLA